MKHPHKKSLRYLADPRHYFSILSHREWPVWLDSSDEVFGDGRYHVIAASPSVKLQCVDGVCFQTDEAGQQEVEGRESLQVAQSLLGDERISIPGCPFPGGLIGYLSYDLVRYWSTLSEEKSELKIPDLMLGRYDWAIVVDKQAFETHLVGYLSDDDFDLLYKTLSNELSNKIADLGEPNIGSASNLTFRTNKNSYIEALNRVFSYIREGDCYQINYAHRMDAETEQSSWSLYQHMREKNPAPYGAYLDYGDVQVLSSSPEKFLSVKGRQVETKPIKGTRPRNDLKSIDESAKSDLLSSEKDRAENLMIVDLLRNDFGRVCSPGSISVPKLFDIESFATVHHLVSTVRGQLADDATIADLLMACFPGGSITGAPKLRAMQLIDELEPVRRDLYCGSILCWGFDGNLESSISIRTLVKQDNQLHYWAGGGIVADSVAEDEYQESLDKAATFLKLLNLN